MRIDFEFTEIFDFESSVWKFEYPRKFQTMLIVMEQWPVDENKHVKKI